MVLVRLAYVADLPAPAELVRGARDGARRRPPRRRRPRAARHRACGAGAASPRRSPASAGAPRCRARRAPRRAAPRGRRAAAAAELREVVALFEKHREALLRAQLYRQCASRPLRAGRIECGPTDGAPRDLANRLGQLARRMDRRALGRQRLERAGRADPARAGRRARARRCAARRRSIRWCAPCSSLSRRAHRGGARARRAGSRRRRCPKAPTKSAEGDEL